MKEKKQIKLKRRFSMKLQIMLLCVICTLLTIAGIFVITFPKVIASQKVSTEAHMNDFVAAHSGKIENGVITITNKLDLIIGQSNELYDLLNKIMSPSESNNKQEEELSITRGRYVSLIENMKKEMVRLLELDPNENAEVFITDAQGGIVNSTKEYEAGTTLSEEEYQSYITEDEQLYTGAHFDEEKQELVLVFARTIHNNGEVKGVIVYKTNSDYINSLLQDYTLTEIPAPRIYIANSEGMIIAHTNKESIGTITSSEVLVPAIEKMNNGEADDLTHTGYFDYQGENVSVSYVYVPEAKWIIGLNVLDSEIYHQVTTIQKLYLLASILVVAVVVLAIFFFATAFTKPLEYINEIIAKIADLDFTFDVNDKQFNKIRRKNDEIGDMGRSVENMIVAVKENLDEILHSSEEVNAAALQLKTITTDISEKASDNSAITEELSAGIEETTASTDIITSNVQSVQENVTTVKEQVEKSTDITLEIMKRASDLKEQALNAEKETRTAFDEIKRRGSIAIEQSKATAQINELAQVIMDIANQTSLLSLNASIEAARAGESGKGFAVVADEIGNLAQQSSDTVNKIKSIVENVNDAVSNIRDCLTASQDFVEENVYKDYEVQLNMVENYNNDAEVINQRMNEIDKNTVSLYKTMKSIGDSIKEINCTIQEASIGVSDIAMRNSDIGESTSCSYEMVENMDSISSHLDESVKAFKL